MSMSQINHAVLKVAISAILLQAAVTNAASSATKFASRPYRHLEVDDPDGDHDDESKPWGLVIGFTLLVNLATLSGVAFLIPMLSRKARAWVKSGFGKDPLPEITAPSKNKVAETNFLDIAIPSFASGALLATSVFLIIPEGLYLIQSFIGEKEEDDHRRFLEGDEEEDGDEHSGEFTPDAIWRFGASLLGGFMLPMLFDFLFPRNSDHFEGDGCDEVDFQEDLEGAKAEADTKTTRKINKGLVLSIILGDAFHNFCDGIFIGVALTLCDLKTAYVIVGVTLYHEVAQELADYFLLTKHGGLTPAVALGFNFLAGLSCMVGGLTVLAIDVSNMSIGVILSISSGVYLYIACCECLPRVSEVVTSSKQRLFSMAMFIVGVVPIGLALLNHSHCEAEEHDDH